ncbi:MAG: dual specificity protein phosphatase family protein [Chloroflexi bacterium]|nr:dual specificity protein phosphatase family protein [Chloroflexota bacterium]
MPHRFGTACPDETIVFGAQRPGYNAYWVEQHYVEEWLAFMRGQAISRVVCLLPPEQLDYYESDLLSSYREAFGPHNVLSAPIGDFCLSSEKNLKLVMDFLDESVRLGLKTVVHCSGGSGRTGHVLAAWLVYRYDMEAGDAIETIRRLPERRNPLEAVTTPEEEDALYELLDSVRGSR